MTFFGETEHFSGKSGALRWSILVGKQKHNVKKPISVFQGSLLVIVIMIDSSEKRNCEGGFRTFEFACL